MVPGDELRTQEGRETLPLQIKLFVPTVRVNQCKSALSPWSCLGSDPRLALVGWSCLNGGPLSFMGDLIHLSKVRSQEPQSLEEVRVVFIQSFLDQEPMGGIIEGARSEHLLYASTFSWAWGVGGYKTYTPVPTTGERRGLSREQVDARRVKDEGGGKRR